VALGLRLPCWLGFNAETALASPTASTARASQIIKYRSMFGFLVLPYHLLVVLDDIITGNCHW
jgi:hypothetical protein